MIRSTQIAAVALFSAALLIISTSHALAAAAGDETNVSTGTSRGMSGAPPASRSLSPSQHPPQGLTQGGQPTAQGVTGRPGGLAGRSSGQVKGAPVAEATVIGVDQPDNCLRIRRGPSLNYEQIGCARLGQKLNLSGIYTGDNRWAQLDSGGWVFSCQIKTDFRPPGPQVSCGGPPVGRVWREPATSSGPTYLYERDFYGPSWGGYRGRHHHHHHDGHPGGGPQKK